MLPINRKKKIIDELSIKGKVEILELVELLGVSAMTIRRDLDELEKQKKLIRTHGGAALPQAIIGEQSYEQKLSEAHIQKKEIAQIAVGLVKDGMRILLDSGTTTLEIARLLKSRTNITVVTNDIKIAAELTDSNLEVILLGGKIQNGVGAILGSYAEQMLKNIHVDILFLGAHAVHASLGISSATFEKASIKKEMINVSEAVYLTVDAHKFGKKAFAKIAGVDSVTGIITDSTISKEVEEIYKEKSTFIKGVTK
ncbi:DeoR/GlpR transcriptional regulator [Psychrobacillus sp. AK 1817]|uniref:DeoR/GlpR family DNA-binding transcription regulator n=1 Tax=Psychrobacillus sp. AK 1817 TaxID=2303505 RepID=UPI001243FED0|nr:DeoR/GlpR family DNA-binding transcription regulator [Psychrobacillus sp. AK 1817]QEY19808.1 DeoR/GlpR transcriptional regulator [Psychrobacillus sp. AK 1817]